MPLHFLSRITWFPIWPRQKSNPWLMFTKRGSPAPEEKRLTRVDFILSLLTAMVFLTCSCLGAKTLFRLNAQGKATLGQAFNSMEMPPQEVPGPCEPCRLLQNSHRSGQGPQFTKHLSDWEHMSHLSKNGRNKYKGALVLTGNLASKAFRQTGRVWLKTGLRSSLIGHSQSAQL